jgi:hypothetical protein
MRVLNTRPAPHRYFTDYFATPDARRMRLRLTATALDLTLPSPHASGTPTGTPSLRSKLDN